MCRYKWWAATLLVALAAVLTGCYDSMELEDRGFVNAISIDRNPGDPSKPFRVGAELMALDEDVSKDKGGKAGERDVQYQQGAAFTEATRLINAHSSRSLYFGLTKVCLFGEELLLDEGLLRAAMDGLERSGEFYGNTLVLAVPGVAGDMLSQEIADEKSLGFFVHRFYKNNENQASAAIKLDLEELAEALNRDGCAVAPVLAKGGEGGAPRFSGAAVISSWKLAGYLSEEETRGLMWIKEKARGTQLTADAGPYAGVILDVGKARAGIRFMEDEEGLACFIDVKVTGTLAEMALGEAAFGVGTGAGLDGPGLCEVFESMIAEDIRRSFESTAWYGVDGFALGERLRRLRPRLYAAYGEALREDLPGLRLAIEVNVNIVNTGRKR